MKKKNKKFDTTKAVAAARRKAHFESGGDVAQWRGRATVFKDRKKAANKKHCRKAIKSQEY